MGLLLNVLIIAVIEMTGHLFHALTTTSENTQESLACKSSGPAWDTPDLSRFNGGTDLVVSGEFIWNAMTGIREPVVDGWFLCFGVAVTVLLTPITEPNTPPLDESGNLLWAPNVIRGIPSWAFQVLMVLIPVTLFLLYVIHSIPNNLFPNSDKSEELYDVTFSEVAMETTPDYKSRTSTSRPSRMLAQAPTFIASNSSSSLDNDV
jgi:hypothetical protein